MPSIPSEFTVTCDICNTEAISPTPIPDGWSMVAGPRRAGNNPMSAQPAYLCSDHTAAYETFWKPRQPGVQITVA